MRQRHLNYIAKRAFIMFSDTVDRNVIDDWYQWTQIKAARNLCSAAQKKKLDVPLWNENWD